MDEEKDDYKYCRSLKKYCCLNCNISVCNMSLDCSILAPETRPGWNAGESDALCKACDKDECFMTSDDAEDEISINEEEPYSESEEEMDDEKNVTIDCASRGFHVYRTVWKPKLTDKLMVLFEKTNVSDPYACGIFSKSREKISGKCLVGHMPREISRFCKYFIGYGGKIKAAVVSCQFRRSPLPKDGLEIPLKLSIARRTQ